MDNIISMMNKSKCATCEYRLVRLFEPLTQEDRDYYAELFELDDIDEMELYLEQYKCLVTGEDLNGVIHECTEYAPKTSCRLIREYKY